MAKTPLWQRKKGKSPTGGLTAAAKNNTGKDRLSLSLKKWNCKGCGGFYKDGGFLEPPIENIFE